MALTEPQERLLLLFKMGGRVSQGRPTVMEMPDGSERRVDRRTMTALIHSRKVFVEPSCTYWIHGYDGWKMEHAHMRAEHARLKRQTPRRLR